MQNKYSAPNTQVETATCFDSFFVAGFCVCVCVCVCVCKLLETRRFNTLLCCQKVHVCIFYRPSHRYFSTQGGIPPIRVNA